MKKILLFVSIFAMLLFLVSCKGVNTNTPEKEEEVTITKTPEEPKTLEEPATPEQPANPEQPIINPPEDLSIAYYYIGDMLFADSMDFDKWYFTNGGYNKNGFEGYVLKVEKIGRVHNPNQSTMMFRYSETLEDVERYETNPNWFYVEDATNYKIWVSKEFMNPENKQYWQSETELINLENSKAYSGIAMIDGTWIKLTYSQNEMLEDVYTFDYRESAKAQYYN